MLDLSKHRILVTGGAGFLGRFVVDALRQRGVPDDKIFVVRRADYDLTHEGAVERLYHDARPEVVIHLAAEVGGIGANRDKPGRFFYANMAMGMHLIECARRHGVRKFLQTGTVCAYPKFAPVPFREEDLWEGYPEETNAPYGVAKKALFVMLEAYRQQYGLPSAVVLPVNLFGPYDNFHLHTSHVVPALIRKCVEARQRGDDHIVCWGTGAASREFLFVQDAAEGILAAAERIDNPVPINLGTGQEVSIGEVVTTIAELTGFQGRIEWDASKPDGQPRRCLDVARAKDMLGWTAAVNFREGLKRTITWYEQHQDSVREVVYQ
jgi:GDP-L-fucose synthase